jgi:hypothetical protein
MIGKLNNFKSIFHDKVNSSSSSEDSSGNQNHQESKKEKDQENKSKMHRNTESINKKDIEFILLKKKIIENQNEINILINFLNNNEYYNKKNLFFKDISVNKVNSFEIIEEKSKKVVQTFSLDQFLRLYLLVKSTQGKGKIPRRGSLLNISG